MKLTKGKVLSISILISIVLLIADNLGNTKLCTTIGYLDGNIYPCMDVLYLIELMFLSFLPITIFSLITYPLREETFRSWLRFAKWWVPMSMLLVLITPDGQSGGYMPSLIDKQVVAFLTSAVFIIISLIIVLYKSIKLRGK